MCLNQILETNSSLFFRKSTGPIKWIKEHIFKREPELLRFDLDLFNSRTDFFLSKLKSGHPESLGERIGPENLEESLALLEAATQFNPDTKGITSIKRWLLRADTREAKQMVKLLKFNPAESPVALYTKVSRLVILSHSSPENISKALNSNLSDRAIYLISARAKAALVTESFEDALVKMGFSNAEGLRVRAKKFYENHPNISSYALFSALVTGQIATFGTMFSGPKELLLLQGEIQKLSREEKIKLLNGDFTSVRPNLVGAVKREDQVRMVLRIIGIVGMIALIYFLQDELRHQLSTTRSEVDRKKLENKAFDAAMKSYRDSFDKEPSAKQIKLMRKQTHEDSDAILEITVDPTKLTE